MSGADLLPQGCMDGALLEVNWRRGARSAKPDRLFDRFGLSVVGVVFREVGWSLV